MVNFMDEYYQYTIIEDSTEVRVQVREDKKNETYYPLDIFNEGVVTYEDETYSIAVMDECFQDCIYFNQEITIPETVYSIYACFRGCISFNSQVTFDGDDVYTIAHCFEGCESFNQPIKIPSYTTDASYCFYNCRELNSLIDFSDNSEITEMDYCFYNCINFNQSVIIPSSIEYLESCFENCSSLANNIIIKGGVNENYCEKMFSISDQPKQIYIINQANSYNYEIAEETWRSLVLLYPNVHYEADDATAPEVFLEAKRVDDQGKESSISNKILITINYTISNTLPYGTIATDSLYFDNQQVVIEEGSYPKSITKENIKDQKHIVSYTVSDGYKTTSKSVTLTRVMAILDFQGYSGSKYIDKEGMGMAIGTIATRNGLDIKFPTSVGEGLLPATQPYNPQITNDTTLDLSKKYYIYDLRKGKYYDVNTTNNEVNPKERGWYEAEGESIDLDNYQLIVGKYNKQNDDAVFIVGNGANNENRSNLMEVGDSITIGSSDGSQSYISLNYNSMQLIDKENDTYFYVSDLRDKDQNWETEITEVFNGDGTNRFFQVTLPVLREVSASDSSHLSNVVTRDGTTYTFTEIPSKYATVEITYITTDSRAKAYTFGKRKEGTVLGPLSVAEGYKTIASGAYSHAEGHTTIAMGHFAHAEGRGYDIDSLEDEDFMYELEETIASGIASHAEGYGTQAIGKGAHSEGIAGTTLYMSKGHRASPVIASGNGAHAEGKVTSASGLAAHSEGVATRAMGNMAHAQNFYTKATQDAQTVIGTCNISDTTPAAAVHPSGSVDYGNYAFIIGNGYFYQNKGVWREQESNALTVDWNGNIELALDTTAASGTIDGDLYAAIVALGWDSDVID